MKELRYFQSEIRKNTENSNIVEGYALNFNKESRVLYEKNVGYFIEKINKRALEGVIEKSDIFCYLNHNQDKGVLARSLNGVGSLNLSIDNEGLKYSFELGKSNIHQELNENLERKEITASSFCFSLPLDKSGEKISRGADGMVYREILKFDRLYDVSPVYQPAYESTSVQKNSIRSIEEFIEIENRNKQKERDKKLDIYFISMKNKYLK